MRQPWVSESTASSLSTASGRSSRSYQEQAAVNALLDPVFGSGFKPAALQAGEQAVIDRVIEEVVGHFDNKSQYPLGLAIDFALLAQALSEHDPRLTKFEPKLRFEDLESRYEVIEKRGKKTANTLTLRYQDQEIGIRRFEQNVRGMFLQAQHFGYPSAYVYNTGQWRKFQSMLVACFSLSAAARFELCNALIDFGFSKFPKNEYVGRPNTRPRVFEQIVTEYPRKAENENSGLAWQAIAYGYACADRPHLRLATRRVRAAGSTRVGDVDGFDGLDLELAIEVKDKSITAANYEKELGKFAAEVEMRGAIGIAFVGSIDDEAREALQAQGVESFTADELEATIALWDYRKQDIAVRSTMEFLQHIEQNPKAVERLLSFFRERDPEHDLLSFGKAKRPEAPALDLRSAQAESSTAQPPERVARRRNRK